MKCRVVIMLISTLLLAPKIATAVELDVELDARTRAKISNAKAKIAMQEGRSRAMERGKAQAPCGSQNIGAVDAEGPRGAPREVIVYAPNSINYVSSHGCRQVER